MELNRARFYILNRCGEISVNLPNLEVCICVGCDSGDNAEVSNTLSACLSNGSRGFMVERCALDQLVRQYVT